MATRTRTIRPSSLTTAADCLRRWAAHNLTDELTQEGYDLAPQRPVHVGAAVGSGVHAGVEYSLASKRSTGTLGNTSEAEDRAVHELRERAQEGLDTDDTTPNLGVAQVQVARMTRAYRAWVPDEFDPAIVETRFHVDLRDGWAISGQPDSMTGSPNDILHDLKTGTVKRVNAVQYGAYALLLRQAGHAPQGIVEDFLRRTKVKAEQPLPVATEIPLAEAAQDALDLIVGLKRAVETFTVRVRDQSGRHPPSAFPANPSSPLCAARWCRAYGTSFCSAAKMKGDL